MSGSCHSWELVATAGMVILSLIQPAQQIEWLYKDNGIAIQHLQILYILLTVVFVPVVIFEPAIRRELREAHTLGLLAFIGMVVSFLVIRLIVPDQGWRFFRSDSAGLLWFVIVHVVLLCVLAVLLVLDRPHTSASERTRRYALIVLAIGGLVLLGLHIASLGLFMVWICPTRCGLDR